MEPRLAAKAKGDRQLSNAERATLAQMRDEIRLPRLVHLDTASR